MKVKLVKYNKVYTEFQQFFDTKSLKLQLERKADADSVDKLNTEKATRQEMEFTHSLIESLNSRLKHLSIVQTEMASSLVPVQHSINEFDDKTKKRLLQKLEDVWSQSNIVSSWINELQLDQHLDQVRTQRLGTLSRERAERGHMPLGTGLGGSNLQS